MEQWKVGEMPRYQQCGWFGGRRGAVGRPHSVQYSLGLEPRGGAPVR